MYSTMMGTHYCTYYAKLASQKSASEISGVSSWRCAEALMAEAAFAAFTRDRLKGILLWKWCQY